MTRQYNKTIYREFFSNEKGRPYFLLLLLLLFTSLRPDTLLPGGKVLMYLPSLLTFLLLLSWISAKKKKLKNNQTKFFIALLGLMIIQLPFVKNLGYSTMAIKSMFIYTFTFYIFVVQFLDSYNKLNRYIRLFAVLGCLFALLGIVGAGKISVSVLQDENDFCLRMNIMIPFAFFLGMEANNFKNKIFYFLLALLYFAGNIATFSRGGFLGFVSVSLFLFMRTRKKFLFLTIGCIVIIGVVFYAPQQYFDEINSIDLQSYQKDTGATRIESWKAGWRMFLDHPVIGVGAYNFGVWHADYYDQNKNPGKMWGRVVHSLYFTLVPEMGIVGTFFFFGMLWYNYKNYRFISSLEKHKANYLSASVLSPEEKSTLSNSIKGLYCFSNAYTGAMIAYLVTGIFISVLWYGYFWSLTAFSVATHNIALKAEELLVSAQISQDDNEERYV